MIRIHLEVERRACGCGDSYCGECRSVELVTACGSTTRSSAQRTQREAQVTCLLCRGHVDAAAARRRALEEAKPKARAGASTPPSTTPPWEALEMILEMADDMKNNVDYGEHDEDGTYLGPDPEIVRQLEEVRSWMDATKPKRRRRGA